MKTKHFHINLYIMVLLIPKFYSNVTNLERCEME